MTLGGRGPLRVSEQERERHDGNVGQADLNRDERVVAFQLAFPLACCFQAEAARRTQGGTDTVNSGG